LTVAALGEGRARYRVIAIGATSEPAGLGVERVWSPSGPCHVGDLVTVRIEVVLPKRAPALIIREHFPAGLAPVRSTLSAKPPFVRVEQHHGQIELETGPVEAGVVRFEYQARAMHGGRYRAPPVEATAELRGAHSAAATIEIAQ
jgi:hypothetical protein